MDLKFVNISPPSQIFLRMLHDEEFDASEMSLSNFMIAMGKGDRRFVAIPVFPSRVFRHSYIWVNTKAGIAQPADLKGKKVGIADYSMTALLFVCGLLQHEYGVAPQDIHWFRRLAEHVAIDMPAGIRIDNIGKEQTLDDLLETGELDAVSVTSSPRMLVDLGRNDVGRVATMGSVAVPEFLTIEKYSHVMHIVSDVRGNLQPGRNSFDVLKACFPAGTVSGAPKVRAMEIIEELEPSQRGPYAGAVGYFSFSGNMDFCIVIRTLIIANGTVYFQAGAGIVADSQPENEFQETINKAKALVKALQMINEGIE